MVWFYIQKKRRRRRKSMAEDLSVKLKGITDYENVFIIYTVSLHYIKDTLYNKFVV